MSVVAVVLMAVLPVTLAVLVSRGQRYAVSELFAGAVAFVGSQAVHLPLNFGIDRLAHAGFVPQPTGTTAIVVSGVVLGLSGGIDSAVTAVVAEEVFEPVQAGLDGQSM